MTTSTPTHSDQVRDLINERCEYLESHDKPVPPRKVRDELHRTLMGWWQMGSYECPVSTVEMIMLAYLNQWGY